MRQHTTLQTRSWGDDENARMDEAVAPARLGVRVARLQQPPQLLRRAPQHHLAVERVRGRVVGVAHDALPREVDGEAIVAVEGGAQPLDSLVEQRRVPLPNVRVGAPSASTASASTAATARVLGLLALSSALARLDLRQHLVENDRVQLPRCGVDVQLEVRVPEVEASAQVVLAEVERLGVLLGVLGDLEREQARSPLAVDAAEDP